MAERKVVVVSNRLPAVVRVGSDGHPRAEPGSGGLVTALTPVLRQRKGTWIGWPGVAEPLTLSMERTLEDAGRSMGLSLRAVSLSQEEVDGYYRGFATEVLWPLFHDLATNCRFEPSYWECYTEVNRKIAREVSRSLGDGDFVWIQDYHLLTAASELRRLGARNPLGFFLHVPFPAPDTFARLPWRRQILEGLLDFDIVGFQCDRDRDNFLRCTDVLASEWSLTGGSHASPPRAPRLRRAAGERTVTVGSFPISIDYRDFDARARTEGVLASVERLRQHFEGRKILLGVDRLDYTKGLPEKLRGYRLALERNPGLRRRVSLVQHVIPSRESVPHYRELRPEIERLVGEINGQFGTPGWVPVRYFYHSLSNEELSAYYRLADVLLVTSLKDGMNLVAKEYCASNVLEQGVLVLSEFAGSSSQLGEDALLVNPHDVEAVAASIESAVRMPALERRRRMSNLRRIVEESDVYRWVGSFLETAGLVDERARAPVRRKSISLASGSAS